MTHRVTPELFGLPDGRALAWREYGDPSGAPVLNHHGGLLSGSDVAPVDAVARACGVRLLSFDRPGVGGSSPSPGRTVLDGGRDAEALLDGIGVGPVAVLGWSMGGQYALASAWHLGDRVVRAAVVAGCPPVEDPRTMAELNGMDQRFTRLAADHPRRLSAIAVGFGGCARFLPGAWARVVARSEPADRDAVVRAGRALAASGREGSSQPGGMVEEYRAWVRPWGFALGEVRCPVDLWQGTDDRSVPPVWTERLAAGLPHSTLHLLDGRGHFLMLTRAAEVFAALVG